MTLTEIIATFPDLFYLNNRDWYDGEAFMSVEPEPLPKWLYTSEVQIQGQRMVRAVDLAAKYVKEPEAALWRHFLWTDDVDAWGHRVYVGGVGHDGCAGFQIHRYLDNPPAKWVAVP